MPATRLTKKYCAPKTPAYDPLKGLILERMKTMKITAEDMSRVMHVHPNTARNRLKESLREWRYGEIIDLCVYLEDPLEELRAAVRYIK